MNFGSRFIAHFFPRNSKTRDRDETRPSWRMGIERLFSLKTLLIAGFFVTVIPVIIALTYADYGMRETAKLGENALFQTVERMKVMRVALQRVYDIERKAKLFVLFSDPALRQPYERESYENARASFRQTLNDLLQQSLDDKLTLLINELLEKERLIHEQVTGSEPGASPKLPVEEAFHGLREAANGLWQEVTGRVDRQAEALHRQAQELERRMLIRTTALLSVSMGFFLLLLTVLNRSIRQVDLSIRKLGAGRFAEPVVVKGPQDMRRLGERLEWLRGRLSSLEESRQQFMHNVSLEIKGPLAALRKDAERLGRELQEAGAAAQYQACLRLDDQARRLQTVSDELVRYSRVVETPPSESRKSVDLKALLDAVIADHQPRLDDKSLRIKALTQRVHCDGIVEQLRGIFDQLLSNAIQFSPEGGEIRLMLRTAGGDVEFEVEDDGPGIAEDEREEVLKPFHRGRAAREANTVGAGLGLAMVCEYLAHCQGRIAIVEPRQDHQGARVRIQIPQIV
jgi:two-component system sensor histidine kinase GlrK